jgi:hypothetical protein
MMIKDLIRAKRIEIMDPTGTKMLIYLEAKGKTAPQSGAVAEISMVHPKSQAAALCCRP